MKSSAAKLKAAKAALDKARTALKAAEAAHVAACAEGEAAGDERALLLQQLEATKASVACALDCYRPTERRETCRAMQQGICEACACCVAYLHRRHQETVSPPSLYWVGATWQGPSSLICGECISVQAAL